MATNEVAILLNLKGARDVEHDLQGVQQQFVGLQNVMKATAVVGATAFVALGAAVTGAAVAVGAIGGKFDSMRQQAEIAFTTMLGDGQQAKDFLADLTKFAAETPFELPGLISASQKFLAMGFAAKDVIPILTSVGDAVAGLGGGQEQIDRATLALGQMAAKGKASADEMLQLTELGIPAWQALADKIGVSVPEAMKQVENGTVDSGTAINAVLTSMDDHFAGLMEQQSHTFAGLLSTMKDTFGQAAGQVVEPFFERATHGMQLLADATSTPEFQAKLSQMADGFESLLNAMGPVVDFATQQVPQALQGIGDIVAKVFSGDVRGATADLEETIGGWRDAFVAWAEPAANELGAQLDQMVDGIGQFIEDNSGFFIDKVTKEWVPAFTGWVVEKAIPKVLADLEVFGGRVLHWSQNEGAKFMWDAGLAAGEAYRNGLLSIITGIGDLLKQTFENIKAEIDKQTTANPGERALGYAAYNAENTPPILGPPMPTGEPNVEPTLAPTVAAAADAGTRARKQWDLHFGGGGAGATKAGSEKAGKTAGEQTAQSAIDGFMAALQSNRANLEAEFGKEGGALASALTDAIRENTNSSGAAVAESMDSLITKLREAGVPEWRQVGDDLAGAFHDALIARTPEAQQAALDMLHSVVDAIKTANILTPDTFFAALNAATMAEAAGSRGTAIMSALEKALADGGARNIQALAQSVASMRAALIGDKDLSPESAAAWSSSLMDAVTRAVREGTPEAVAALQEFLQAANFEIPMEKLAANYAEKIRVATETLTTALQTAKDQSNAAIQQAVDSLTDARTLREARQNATDTQAAELAGVVEQVNAARDAWKTYREDQALTLKQTQELTDLQAKQAQALEDLAKKKAGSDTSSTGFGGIFARQTTQHTDPQAAANQAIRALQEQQTKALADLDVRQQRERDAVTERRRIAAEDAEQEKTNQGIIDTFKRTQAGNLQTFLDEQDDDALTRQIGRITSQRDEAIRKAKEKYATDESNALTEFNNDANRLVALRALADTVMDGMVADATSWRDIINEGLRAMASGATGGTSNQDNMAPPPGLDNGFTAMARGGIVTSPTLALIGEHGPEAVIPLNQAGGTTVNVTVNGSVTIPDLDTHIRNVVIDANRSGRVLAR